MSDITFTIDDQKVAVLQGTTVIQAAKKLGIEIPHYCYHPGLSIAGNCRMCLVEIEKMPKPVIACNAVATEGMVVRTQTAAIKKMRESVMEFLLINHPLDCPTCDQAGECRLQDYYMQYDVIPSRFEEKKVHKNKMVDMGSGVMLDEERCIACTRCIRFCQEVAKKDELTLAYRGDHVMITPFPGKKISNAYAGNVVDICPVGALTSKDFRYKKRVWLLKKTPSVCPGCSRGCAILIHHADQKVYRLMPRLNPEVNQYWMCDEGRLGYKFINENRIVRPHIQVNGQIQAVSYENAHEKLGQLIANIPWELLAVVAHAGLTTESLKAIEYFSKNVLKTKAVYFSRNEPLNPSFDDFLITVDKNPNQAEVDKLAFKPLANLEKASGLFVFCDLSEKDLTQVTRQAIPILGSWASNESAVSKRAQVVFPIPTYAEQDGHFTNVLGFEQKTTKAFAPRGEGRSVVQSLRELEGILIGTGAQLKTAARC